MNAFSEIDFIKYSETQVNRETGKCDKLLKIIDTLHLPLLIDAVQYVRNHYCGRGMRDFSYALLYTAHAYYPDTVFYILKTFVNSPIGCWKDVRNYAKYYRNYSPGNVATLETILEIYNTRLCIDCDFYENNPCESTRKCLSFAAKYVPRENKDPQFFEILVANWFQTSLTVVTSWHRMTYRKMVSNLNKALDTVEIRMCAGDWANIQPQNIPCAAFAMYADSLPSKSQHLADYYESVKIPYHYLTNPWQIIRKLLQNPKDERTIEKMNMFWQEYAVSNKSTADIPCDYYIPVLDLSPSMHFNQDNLYKSIATALCLASKSHFGNRILTFSQKIVWIDLSNCLLNVALERILGATVNVQGCFGCVKSIVLEGLKQSGMIEADLEKVKISLISNATEDTPCASVCKK
jgi:hypothetical protein